MNNFGLLAGGVLLIVGAIIGVCFVFRNYMRTGGRRFRADYSGEKQKYENAKDKYRAGQKVTLYYGPVATDTSYDFTLDGRNINPAYDDEKGYVITFTMPAHDITLNCTSKNISALSEEESGE